MSMLDDIKQAMHEAIDKAWEALGGTADLDEARPIVQVTTAALHAQALQVEAQLIKHVADNAVAAVSAEAGDPPAAPSAADPAPEVTEPAVSGPTGMAQNPAPAAPTADVPTAETPVQ